MPNEIDKWESKVRYTTITRTCANCIHAIKTVFDGLKVCGKAEEETGRSWHHVRDYATCKKWERKS